jgi:hypothetical protein
MGSENLLKSVCERAKSWVMISPNTNEPFIKLPNERVLHISPSRTSLALTSPNQIPGQEPWSVKSDGGIVYITNQRVYNPPQLSLIILYLILEFLTNMCIILDSLHSHSSHTRTTKFLMSHSKPPRHLRTSSILWRKLLDRNCTASSSRRNPSYVSYCRTSNDIPRGRGVRLPYRI